MATKPKFEAIPAITDPDNLRLSVDPVREMVRRRSQGGRTNDRWVSRQDLLDLGLVTEDDLSALDN